MTKPAIQRQGKRGAESTFGDVEPTDRRAVGARVHVQVVETGVIVHFRVVTPEVRKQFKEMQEKSAANAGVESAL